MFDVLPWTLMGDEKVELGEKHEGELSMFKTPRRSRRKDNTLSTPATTSIPVPTPTTTHVSTPGSAKRTKSTKTKNRPICFLNHPNVNSIVAGINESFKSAHSSALMKIESKKVSIVMIY